MVISHSQFQAEMVMSIASRKDVERASHLERFLMAIDLQVIDSHLESPRCVCPRYHPAMFRR